PVSRHRRHDLSRSDDRGPARHLRLPGRSALDGAASHSPYDLVLARRREHRGPHRLRRLLLCVSLRSAPRAGGGGGRERRPRSRYHRDHDRPVADERSVGIVRAVLWLCFGLSGVAALGFELLWMRSAGLVLGATATTTSTVLACYFTGLGLGAALGRRTSTGGVRRYAFLELGAAAGGLWSLLVFRSALATGMLALAAAMLPATLCLGATLPVLGQ